MSFVRSFALALIISIPVSLALAVFIFLLHLKMSEWTNALSLIKLNAYRIAKIATIASVALAIVIASTNGRK
jgi:hypothetical protein